MLVCMYTLALVFPVHRPQGVCSAVHNRRCRPGGGRGNAVPDIGSVTCPPHLTVSLLVAACAVWLRKGNPYIVLSSACAIIRSRGRLRVGLLHLGRDSGCQFCVIIGKV